MITYRRMDASCLARYDEIPVHLRVESVLEPQKMENGLGGILFKEVPVEPRDKDFAGYERAAEFGELYDIANWGFFMAFDGEKPVGGVTVAAKTSEITEGRDDLCILWDIRVDDAYKRRGVGDALFGMAVDWARAQNCRLMKMEAQNNNVPACNLYVKHGALLGEISEYAYEELERQKEVMLVWHLKL